MSDHRNKIVVLGGSALATPRIFEVLQREAPSSAYDFVLVGRDEEKLDLIYRVSEDILREADSLDVTVATSTDLHGSLAGADYCINQIRVGGMKGRLFDETFPREFGIPGEETVGPGGFANSLRGIPLTLEICRTLEQVAPQVTLLNLTNPSSIVHYAIRRYTSVNVVGTCDAPVSLMEMIARVLGVPADGLEFELGGMHHFTWIVGVKQNGVERLPEVMDHLGEMAKLGTDPELVRALGAIPSGYFKYYAHPDRILAATEGRTPRAQQLIDLYEQILDDYRAWQPGQPRDMVSRRGAAWYDKIVVPTLTKLSDHQNTNLVLSTDNNGAFPFLPDEAIVEGWVPLRDGVVQKPLSVEFPQDIQAMISQNCAYEMLAAEAIVEQDRDTAIRALMSNLMVRDFNQVRGILQKVWPGEETFSLAVEIPEKAETTREDDLGFKIPTLTYGDHLLEEFNLPEGSYALITMEEPWELAQDRLARQPDAVAFVRELDWYRLEALERALPPVEAVVGLGGGTATDAAKYVAWRRGLPVDAIPSITSVDAAVTKSIAARAGGHVTYIGYIVPRHVFIDSTLIQGAPVRLNISGVGDILCAHTALWDWNLAHQHIGEAYDQAAVDAVRGWLQQIHEQAAEIKAVSPAGIRTIMQGFEEISIICRRFGSSRPQEASEHTFAYNAEFQTGKGFLHGELVSLGSYVMARLQGNNLGYLTDVFEGTGIRWQPQDVGLTKDEFTTTLETLNWYQANFGRRYSVLDERTIDQPFIDEMVSELVF